MRLDADLVVGLGLGLRLGLGLTVTGTGLGASNAGRGNALASSRRCRGRGRSRRRRGDPSGFRASSSLGGARNGGGPSRFNQVLLRSVVWFGGATERHYHNKGNGAGRAPAETGGPLFRKHWLAAFGRACVRCVALRRSQSQVASLSCAGCCCTAHSAVRIQPKLAHRKGRALSPQPRQRQAGQARPRQGKARQSRAKQGRAGQHDSKQGPGWAVVTVLSLARSSLALTLTRREIRAQRDRRDRDGSCACEA